MSRTKINKNGIVVSMKMENKEQGFGGVAVLLIVVIVGVIAYTGWSVYKARNNNPAPSVSALKSSSKLVTGKTTTGIDNVLQPYTLPKGWEGVACQNDSVTILVPGEVIKSCDEPISNPTDAKSPDAAYLGVFLRNLAYLSTDSCSETLAKRDNKNIRFA